MPITLLCSLVAYRQELRAVRSDARTERRIDVDGITTPPDQ